MVRSLASAALVLCMAGLFGCDRQPLPSAQFVVRVDEQFTITPGEFECRPGQTVRIRITNVIPVGGPDLAHNLVLTREDLDLEAFGQATFQASERQGYIPSQYAAQVLAKTPLIHPGETGELAFTAPSKPGRYPLICTFPGHCTLGMRAVLVVKQLPQTL